MTTITNLSEDDRDLISWHVREFMDTYEMYNPGRYSRRYVMQACFTDLRQWSAMIEGETEDCIRFALRELETRRLRLPEKLEAARAAEAAYWHRAPRSWE